MSRWLRINEDCIDHPKLLKLPEALRWQWVALLCVASKNGGVLPPIDDVALCLRVPEAKAAEYITKLVKAKLIDQDQDGSFAPHNWNKRQFKSDLSTDRVKRHRETKRNVSPFVSGNVSCGVAETVTETPPEQSRAETEQNTADGRALDELGLKNEKALCALFTALCLNLSRSPPDLRPINGWLLDGIAMGTISAAVTPILKRKADMKSLGYCDAAVREAHAGAGPNLQVVEPTVLVIEGTLECTCWSDFKKSLGQRLFICEQPSAEGRVVRGARVPSHWPPGYNDFGERIPPQSEDAA